MAKRDPLVPHAIAFVILDSFDIIEGCQFCWCFPSGSTSDSHMTEACTYPPQIIASSQLFMCVAFVNRFGCVLSACVDQI